MSNTELYRCTDCGKESVSIGWLHAHIDAKHHGFGPFNIIPNPFAIGNFNKCMAKTEIVKIEETSVERGVENIPGETA